MVKDTLAEHPGALAIREDTPLWLASWANPYRCMEWIHRYVFPAPTRAAAQEKIDAWIRRPSVSLPPQARMRPRRLVLHELPEYPLEFWQFTWPEDGELHTLILFGLDGQRAASWQAWEWTRTRYEPMERLQLLRRLTAAERVRARFDPNEGVELLLPL